MRSFKPLRLSVCPIGRVCHPAYPSKQILPCIGLHSTLCSRPQGHTHRGRNEEHVVRCNTTPCPRHAVDGNTTAYTVSRARGWLPFGEVDQCTTDWLPFYTHGEMEAADD